MRIGKYDWELIRRTLEFCSFDPRALRLARRLGFHGAIAATEGVEPADMTEPEPNWEELEKAEEEAAAASYAQFVEFQNSHKDIEDGNLKAFLMELGNDLVTTCGFNPADVEFDFSNDGKYLSDTSMIVAFTEWLNNVPEAREILAQWGYEWPIMGQKR